MGRRGRPKQPRVFDRGFWAGIRAGLGIEEAALGVGMSETWGQRTEPPWISRRVRCLQRPVEVRRRRRSVMCELNRRHASNGGVAGRNGRLHRGGGGADVSLVRAALALRPTPTDPGRDCCTNW